MTLLVSSFAIIALYYITQKLYIAFLKPGIGDIPGDLLSRFTDLQSVYKGYTGQWSSWLQHLHKQHGTLVRIGPNRLSVSDVDTVKRIYALKDELPKSDQLTILNNVIHGKIVESVVGTRDKNYHASLRRPVANLFSMTSISNQESFIDDTINLFMKRLDEEFIRPRKACNIDKWLQYFAFDVVTALTMSTRQGFLEKGGDVDGMLKELQKETNYRDMVLYAPWLEMFARKNPLYMRFTNATTNMVARASAIVMQRLSSKTKVGADGRHDMLAHFIELHVNKSEEIPKARVIAYTATNILAGSDTTSVSFRSVLYHCLKSPGKAVFKRLQTEIDSANLQFPASYKAVSKLSYLDAVVKEAMRLHPVSASILEREVGPKALHLLDGRILPAGTFIGASGLTVHFDQAVFGADADIFNPDRWLQSASESKAEYAARLRAMKAVDLSWGMGSRTCLGKNVAVQEIYKTMTTMCGIFDMELVNPTEHWEVTDGLFRVQSNMDIYISWRPGKSLDSLVAAVID